MGILSIKAIKDGHANLEKVDEITTHIQTLLTVLVGELQENKGPPSKELTSGISLLQASVSILYAS
ncbi:hypothetical protein H0H87_003705 [Tephrocybe sp. NHM501043]|nr:hypothetical protein H0H87_003705 [Tephrocybe sp. NHM501043]